MSIISTAHTGSYGVSPDAAGSKIEQVIPGLCPNTTYTVSSWGIAKVNAGVYLGVKNYGGSELTVQFTESRSWKQESITFTTGSSNYSATIFFTKTSTSKFKGTGDDFDLVIVN